MSSIRLDNRSAALDCRSEPKQANNLDDINMKGILNQLQKHACYSFDEELKEMQTTHHYVYSSLFFFSFDAFEFTQHTQLLLFTKCSVYREGDSASVEAYIFSVSHC